MGCLDGCNGLLKVFQAELQLVGVEPRGAAAKVAALQLPDQETQLLDLGLRRITLAADGVPLSQNSIVLNLQRDQRGILLGDDFRHLLQQAQ